MKTLGDPFELDEALLQFRSVCDRFVEREITPHVLEWEEAEAFPRALYRQAAEVGILGAGFPEELGGSGGDSLFAFIASESLIRSGSTGVTVGLQSLGIALPPILFLGDDEQKKRFAEPVLRGHKIAALAVTEPGAGSDVAGLRTSAKRDGDGYRLNGSKLFITSGVRADQITVLARTSPDRHGGLTFFVVDADSPGFCVSKALKKTGWRASDTAELVFNDVYVPEENRLGAEGSGFIAVMQNFVTERLSLAFYGHATAETAFEDALEYSRQREAFGKPIGRFQVIGHRLAEMATQVTAAKTLNYRLALRHRAGESLVGEVAMAKNFSSKVAVDVCYAAVQILGGMGYMRETRVERLSRDARVLPIGGGSHEIMNEVINRWVLGGS